MSGDIHTRKICTVSWNYVCRPWENGGLDLKSTRSINASLLLHLSWKLFTQDSQRSTLFQQRFISFGTPRSRYFKSSIWPGVKEFFNTVTKNSVWIIGNGEKINLWLDNWMGSSLVSTLNTPPNMYPFLTAKLQSIIINGRWQLLPSLLNYPTVTDSIKKITLPITPLPDKRVWIHASDGTLTVKLAFQFLYPPSDTIEWASIIWRPCIPSSHWCPSYCSWASINTFCFSSASPCIHATLAKISSLVTMSGMHSNGNCISLDIVVLNKLLIPPSYRHVKDIVLVVWKPPTITWVKANTDGSVIDHNASCGGIFRDFRGTFLGCFASNVGRGSVFEAELLGFFFAMEFAAKHN